MKELSKFVLLVGLLLSFQLFAAAPVLRVGVPDGYVPMSYLDGRGIPQGVSVELWEEIAKTEHLSFIYVPLDSNMAENWNKIRQKQIDILLGPVTVDTDVSTVEFSLPFFVNPISAVMLKKRISFKDMLSGAISDYLNYLIIGYVLFFFLYLNGIWFIERFSKLRIDVNPNKREVPKKYLSGLWFLFYHHMTLDNHFFEVKKTNLSRVLYALYFHTSFIFLTIIGATLTAILTTTSISSINVAELNESILQQKSFAYMSGRPFFKDFTYNRHIDGVPADDMGQAVNMIRTHQVDGIINTQILSERYLRLHRITDMAISPYSLGYIFIYIGLPPHSPYEELINRNIVALQRTGVESAICRKYEIGDPKYCSFY